MCVFADERWQFPGDIFGRLERDNLAGLETILHFCKEKVGNADRYWAALELIRAVLHVNVSLRLVSLRIALRENRCKRHSHDVVCAGNRNFDVRGHAQAERNYRRASELVEENLISRELFENSKTEYELAKNALERSQRELAIIDERLTKTQILAPFDCTILTRPVSMGQAVYGSGGFNSGRGH